MRSGAITGEDDETETKQNKHELKNGNAFLKHDFIGQKANASTKRKDFMLRCFALSRKFQNGRLPYLIVLVAEIMEFFENGGVECFEEGSSFGELALLNGGEGVTKDAGLIFDVLQGKGGVGFEKLKAFVN